MASRAWLAFLVTISLITLPSSVLGTEGSIFVRYRAIESWEPDVGIFGYNNAAGRLEWTLVASAGSVWIRSGLSYPSGKDLFEITAPVIATKQATIVVESNLLPRFLVTPLKIDPTLQAVDIGGKWYYIDSAKVPLGWEKFLWKRDYLDVKAVFLPGQGERLVGGKLYGEVGGQRNYYDQSSGLLVLVVYDYRLVDKSSGNTTRMAGKLMAIELSSDPFPWKGQIRWQALAAVSSVLALTTLARYMKVRKRSAIS